MHATSESLKELLTMHKVHSIGLRPTQKLGTSGAEKHFFNRPALPTPVLKVIVCHQSPRRPL